MVIVSNYELIEKSVSGVLSLSYDNFTLKIIA